MALSAGLADTLPTNYEYYTSGGIKSGLSVDQPYFTLNDRNVSIYSGAMHYFRVPRAYWRDRLRKMRAAGLNTVETYIPWNLHEHQSGKYDFGDGGSEMQDFLNVTEFLQTAQEEDMFAIVRPGPYICSEYEFGGFPSWLLREDMTVRSSDEIYMKYVSRFFNVLMPILAMLQFTKGGPIIAMQVENEYGVTEEGADKEYLRQLRELMVNNGIVEVLTTADNPDKGYYGTIPDMLFMTANFGMSWNGTKQLDILKSNQPGKPLMTMEYWSGGQDLWGLTHVTSTADEFASCYEDILSYPASVNIYMFHGGTNFGFLNGALNTNYDDYNSGYTSFTSSYDLVGPISEGGDYTDKYFKIKQLLAKYNPIKTKLPDVPELKPKLAYPSITVEGQLSITKALEATASVFSEKLVSMENLDINNKSGQSFGYVVYRKKFDKLEGNSELLIEGRVCDTLMLLVNGVLLSPVLKTAEDLDNYGTAHVANSTIVLTTEDLEDVTLDLIVENWGRVNVRPYNQRKGLFQGVARKNGDEITDWEIFPLEFKKSWTDNITDWNPVSIGTAGPTLYKAVLTIESEPQDTYVYMENWTKGIVIVNGFVLGRYAHMGPAQTLYLPAPLLKTGDNEIVIFEHYQPAEQVAFSTVHVYYTYTAKTSDTSNKLLYKSNNLLSILCLCTYMLVFVQHFNKGI